MAASPHLSHIFIFKYVKCHSQFLCRVLQQATLLWIVAGEITGVCSSRTSQSISVFWEVDRENKRGGGLCPESWLRVLGGWWQFSSVTL